MAKVSLRAYNREIETMIDRGQLDEAIAHCHHILKTFPKHLETYRLLGKVYLESKRYGDAADIFLRILASVPDDFVAQVGMSIIRDEQNKLDDAIWHMERAFETQPSNPAIQSELQRLYGRRDGVQPPRIRMTRGALAHMYVQGELYPQAISEIKSVLKDDAGRADMQALLARACYKSGLKNEAADVASALLKRYPYSLDANRVLTEILGVEKPENAQIYHQRVLELDPYASQVTGTVFQSIEVPEAAVSIERLDWNGQPVSMQSDWREAKAIGPESGTQREEEPDWLKTSQSATPSQPTPAPIFDTIAPSQPAEDIPDFLRAAGWGESTGAFDESKSTFAEESTVGAEPIAQGDLPDWVKAMKPAESEPAPAAPQQEEDLPDWISNIGKGALSSQPNDLPDWINQPEQPSTTPQATESLDWMNQAEETPTAAMPGADEQLDWLKNLGQETEATSTSQAEEPDWLKGLGSESDFAPQAAETETPDWLKNLGSEPEAVSTEQPKEETDQFDWLKNLNAETEATVPEASSTDFDFLNQLTEEPVLQTPESSPTNADNLGMSEQEQDDSFAWLENLAAKQGASEGLLTKPEDRLEEEPEWVRQAKGLNATQPPAKSTVSEPPASFEELGKSEQEQDDSFAWLEGLAAKQGASEGLLTKPEDRLEQEPEWVRQAKSLGAQEPPTPVTPEPQQEQPAPVDETPDWLRSLDEEKQPEPEQPAKVDEVETWLQDLEGHKAAEPEPAVDETAMWLRNLDETTSPQTPASASIEGLGKSEQEQDDSFAWLESLAAKQGATEGLLTKPEDRLEQEPEWVKQAKDLNAQQPQTAEPEQPAAIDETAAWLSSLDEEKKQPEPAADETAMWLKSLEEAKPESFQATESAQDSLPAWIQDIEQEETPATESTVPAGGEPQPEPEMQTPVEEPVVMQQSKLEEESIPSWLAELDKEEEKSASTDEDLPAWLRSEETAPAAAEPTRATDWKPAEEKQPEIIYSPPLEEPKPEIIYSPPLAEEPEPAAEIAQEQPVQAPEPQKVEPTPAQERYKEPVTRRVPSIPTVDPVLSSARNELSRSNIPGALESYAKLIKRGRFLDEVIYDLREALYRYPVEVNIWQSLGDAYMRANRLQDALDAYTKAEELLR